MKYNISESVVYYTKEGCQVFTWIKKVLESEKLYIVDFDDVLAKEHELTGHDAPNFYVPYNNGDVEIDNYHRDTMIDRIVSALSFTPVFPGTTVSNLNDTIVFDTVINESELSKNKGSIDTDSLKEKYNRIVATIQERFDGHWKTEIPVSLRFLVQTISLDPIRI